MVVNTLEYGDNQDVAKIGSGARRLGTPTLTEADWAEAALQLIAEALPRH